MCDTSQEVSHIKSAGLNIQSNYLGEACLLLADEFRQTPKNSLNLDADMGSMMEIQLAQFAEGWQERQLC